MIQRHSASAGTRNTVPAAINGETDTVESAVQTAWKIEAVFASRIVRRNRARRRSNVVVAASILVARQNQPAPFRAVAQSVSTRRESAVRERLIFFGHL
jgi:hypothetical protein